MPSHLPQRVQLDLCCPAHYTITVQGCLDTNRARWFEDMGLSTDGATTTLTGVVADQAALHGLLARVRDLGLPLVEVRWLDQEISDSR